MRAPISRESVIDRHFIWISDFPVNTCNPIKRTVHARLSPWHPSTSLQGRSSWSRIFALLRPGILSYSVFPFSRTGGVVFPLSRVCSHSMCLPLGGWFLIKSDLHEKNSSEFGFCGGGGVVTFYSDVCASLNVKVNHCYWVRVNIGAMTYPACEVFS